MPLFWLNYRAPNGRAGVVVVVEAPFLLQGRMKAAVAGLDQGFDYADGHQLDGISALLIPENMIGRLLGESDLRRLLATTKKPPGRKRSGAKRSGARR